MLKFLISHVRTALDNKDRTASRRARIWQPGQDTQDSAQKGQTRTWQQQQDSGVRRDVDKVAAQGIRNSSAWAGQPCRTALTGQVGEGIWDMTQDRLNWTSHPGQNKFGKRIFSRKSEIFLKTFECFKNNIFVIIFCKCLENHILGKISIFCEDFRWKLNFA